MPLNCTSLKLLQNREQYKAEKDSRKETNAILNPHCRKELGPDQMKTRK